MITIFKGPHERVAYSREQLFEQVRKTVVHEVGHYFGMDEDQLREMGYGSD
jgi:predicted Zn-dependent protease with MMP-like domain